MAKLSKSNGKGPRNYLNVTIEEKYSAVKAIGKGKDINDVIPPIYENHRCRVPGNLLGVFYSWQNQLIEIFLKYPKIYFSLR